MILSNSDGIILIDKNEGETSFDVVRKAKKAFKNKKVGHAGTLDPFASGLLLILLGQGTKLSNFLMRGKKKYLATMTLGIETDTFDKTGRIVRTVPVPDLSEEEIRRSVQDFAGDIEQTPPAYSAVNIKGRRAYELARQGMEVVLGKRMVTLHSIDVLSVKLPDITFEVTCSKGTYIRTLAVDIGAKLDSAAHLKSLRRISCGSFEVREALNSDMISAVDEGDNKPARIISMKDALPDMKECPISNETARKIRKGIRPERDELGSGDPDGCKGFVKLTDGSSLVAVIELNGQSGDDKEWLKNIRVFT